MKQKKMYLLSGCLKGIAIGLILLVPLWVTADVVLSINDKTSLTAWKLKSYPLEIDFRSQPPKSIEAFFIARGFSAEIAERISRQCVFQVIAKNTGTAGDPIIHISLKNWQVKHKDSLKPIKLKEVWDAQWSEGTVSEASRIAFRWATFPAEQVFRPTGDYGWGMVSIGLPAGEVFDLQVVWQQDEAIKKEWLRGMSCPDE
ncbi:MAG TPA: hypothetical protein ENI84_00625 [Thiothrix sp.]|nr:hypothetical protein [Thiothrix sp.]